MRVQHDEVVSESDLKGKNSSAMEVRIEMQRSENCKVA
jgi:hypothetical protein